MTLSRDYTLQNGKYRIIQTLGQGGFGITYEAEQVALHRRVAIKEFFMKEYCDRDTATSHVSLGTSAGSKEHVEQFRTKFVREAQMIAGLDNPHIIKIHDIFEENGTAYYVMPFLDGGSLADKVKRNGPMPEQEAIGYIKQIGNALDYLHKQNILHLDVKPSNVLLNSAGEAVLIDFGISKHYDEAGSQTSTTPVGISKGYAPIEQYQQGNMSKFSPATDIYSLGATLYFLLSGKTPPEAIVVFETDLPAIAGVSKQINGAIKKAMSPPRSARPQNCESFFQLLETPIIVEKQKATPTKTASIPADGPTIAKPHPYNDEKTELTQESPSRTPSQSTTKKSAKLTWAFVAVGLIAAITVVFSLIPKNSGRINQTQITNNQEVSLPGGTAHYSGQILLGNKTIPLEMTLNYPASSGSSSYGNGSLPLSFSKIQFDSDAVRFELTETNPIHSSIKDNKLGGNVTAIYSCTYSPNGTIKGNGRNFRGQTFTFTLSPR